MKRLRAGRPALARALLAWAWATLAACTTMAVQACPITDWYAQGVADGRAGHASDRLGGHREACPDTTAVPDERAWLEGRREGLAEYCQPHRAVDAGLAGRGYAGVCRDPRYGRLYTAARRVHDTRSRVASIERDIAAKRRDIANGSTSEVRRGFLRRDVLTLESDRNRARSAQSDAEVALDKLRKELGV